MPVPFGRAGSNKTRSALIPVTAALALCWSSRVVDLALSILRSRATKLLYFFSIAGLAQALSNYELNLRKFNVIVIMVALHIASSNPAVVFIVVPLTDGNMS